MSQEPLRRRPGPAPRFTRAEIIEAALELIDEGPADSFTMRRLASHLGINPMTIYGYVADKDEIIEAATLLAVERVHVERAADASRRDRLRAAVHDLYRVSVLHPKLARMVIGRGARAPGLFRTREEILRLLFEAGLEERDALRSLGVLTYYALGFGIGHAGYEPLPDLPVSEFPELTRVADRYAEHASDEAFDLGLDHLIERLLVA